MAMAVKIAVIWLSQNKKAHTPSMTDGVEVSDQSIIKKIYTGGCQCVSPGVTGPAILEVTASRALQFHCFRFYISSPQLRIWVES